MGPPLIFVYLLCEVLELNLEPWAHGAHAISLNHISNPFIIIFINLFFLILFLVMCVVLCVGVGLWIYTQCPWGPEKGISSPLELESQAMVSCPA